MLPFEILNGSDRDEYSRFWAVRQDGREATDALQRHGKNPPDGVASRAWGAAKPRQ
jgi:hypothetical protein